MFCSNQVFSINGHDKRELNLAIKYALNYGAFADKEYVTDDLVLAIGHSARDTFSLITLP